MQQRKLFDKTIPWTIGIGTIAIALRVWRISWGLSEAPGRLGFPDEGIVWGPWVRAFIPLTWSSFDQTNLNYPTLYGYVVASTARLAHALGILGPLPHANPHRMVLVGPGELLVARACSAAMGVATVAIVALIASRMYSRRAGVIAAAFMALAPFEVAYAHIASPDVLLTTCCAVTILLAFGAAVAPRPWLVAAGGLAAGVTTGTKYNGLAMIVPVLWAVLEDAWRHRSAVRAVVLGALALLGLAVGIALSCPPCVLHADRLMEALRNHATISTGLYAQLHNNFIAPTLGWYARPYAYELVASLPFMLGWPLYALTLFGFGVAVWRHELPDRILLAAVVPYFVVMAAPKIVFLRYLMPLLPGLVILAARGVDTLRGRRTAVLVTIAVCGYSLAFGASQVARFSLDQQHEVAQWVAREARAASPTGGVRVGVPDLMLDYYRLEGPLAAERLTHVPLADGHWFDDPPEFVVVPEWYAIAIDRDMPGSAVAGDLARLRSGAAGYREVARWSSSYLQRAFYTSLDPAFAGDLWQGEIGFIVYRRTVDS